MAKKEFNISVKLLTTQFKKGLNSIQNQLKSFGGYIKSAFALGSVTAFMKSISRVGGEFESQMARVKAVSNATNTEFKLMEKAAKKIGATTHFSAQEAASALENLTRNGLKAAEATEALAPVLELAAANGMDLATSADIVTNVLNMYHKNIKDAKTVTDIFSAAAANSATNTVDLYEAFKNIGPTAATLGLTIEETAGALMTLANNGIKGSDAGSKLAQAFSKLSVSKVQDKLRELGINISSDTIKTEGLIGTIKKLSNAGLSVENLTEVFGERAWRGINTLMQNVDKLDENINTVGNSTGTASRMAEQGIGKWEKATKGLRNTWDNAMTGLFETMKPVLTGITNIATTFVKTFINLPGIISAAMGAIAVSITKAVKTAEIRFKELKTAEQIATIASEELTSAIAAFQQRSGNYATLLKTDIALEQLQRSMAKAGLSSKQLTGAIAVFQQALKEFNVTGKVTDATLIKLKTELAGLQSVAAVASVQTAKNINFLSKTLTGIKNVGSKVLSFFGGWVGILITAATIAIPSVIRKIKEHRDALVDLNKIQKQVEEETSEEVQEIKLYEKILKDSTNSIRVRQGALEKLKQIMPGYNAQLSSEGELIEDNTGYIEKYTRALIANAKAKILANKAADLGLEIEQKEDELAKDKANAKVTFGDRLVSATMLGESNGPQMSPEQIRDSRFEKKQQEIDKLKSQYKELEDQIESALNVTTTTTNTGGNGGDDKDETRTTALKKYTKTLKNISEIEKANGYSSSDSALNHAEAIKARKSAAESLLNTLSDLDDLNESDIQRITELRATVESLDDEYNSYIATLEKIKEKEKELKEAEENLANQRKKLSKISIPEFVDRDHTFDYMNDDTENNQLNVDVMFDYKDSLQKMYDDLKLAIDNGDFSGVLGDATSLLDQIADKIAEIGEQATNAQHKVNIEKLNEQLKEASNTLKETKFENIKNIAEGFDRLYRSVKSIGEVFGAEIEWEGFEKLTSAVNGCIQVFETATSVIEAFNKVQEISGTISEILSKKKQQEALITVAAEATKAEATTTAAGIQVAAETAVAGAGAAASQSAIPIVGPILAAGAMGMILGLLAASLPKFANGGILGGNMNHGDQLLFRGNSGEMILNKGQQNNLMHMIDHGGTGNTTGDVYFHISGKNLEGVLRNNNTINNPIRRKI